MIRRKFAWSHEFLSTGGPGTRRDEPPLRDFEILNGSDRTTRRVVVALLGPVVRENIMGGKAPGLGANYVSIAALAFV